MTRVGFEKECWSKEGKHVIARDENTNKEKRGPGRNLSQGHRDCRKTLSGHERDSILELRFGRQIVSQRQALRWRARQELRWTRLLGV